VVGVDEAAQREAAGAVTALLGHAVRAGGALAVGQGLEGAEAEALAAAAAQGVVVAGEGLAAAGADGAGLGLDDGLGQGGGVGARLVAEKRDASPLFSSPLFSRPPYSGPSPGVNELR
jgi:hypothetical protein